MFHWFNVRRNETIILRRLHSVLAEKSLRSSSSPRIIRSVVSNNQAHSVLRSRNGMGSIFFATSCIHDTIPSVLLIMINHTDVTEEFYQYIVSLKTHQHNCVIKMNCGFSPFNSNYIKVHRSSFQVL